MNKNLTSEEILKLSKEDFIKYMESVKEEQYRNIKDVGDPNYTNYSYDEKVGFWCENLNKQMRLQVEKGLDEYIIFNPLWHEAMNRIEPDFDKIMDKVFERFLSFKWEWSKEEYLKRIGKL
jgi:molecular chaperone GrpE (heat shock protein)